jgi:hypothetical protein
VEAAWIRLSISISMAPISSSDNEEEIHVTRSLRSRHIIYVELNRGRMEFKKREWGESVVRVKKIKLD